MNIKKICLVGASSVGKSSLLQRFVTGLTPEYCLPSNGASIVKKEVCVEADRIGLMLWDISTQATESELLCNYLKAASAIIYIVDGTRRDTLYQAVEMHEQVEQRLGKPEHSIVLFNKSDELSRWEIMADDIAALEAHGMFTFCTSATQGDGVQTAFNLIGRVMLGRVTLITADKYRSAGVSSSDRPAALVGRVSP